MTQRPFQLVDVFHDGPFTGNPLAVVFDADGLGTAEMHTITRWLNLSETVFLLRPSSPAADYRVRIFTLERELPFAGHPTLGSCHAWLSNGGKPAADAEIVQECGAGLVRIRPSGEWLAFAAPPLIRGGTVDEATLTRVAAFLQIGRAEIVDAQWADNGPGWVAVLLASADAVLALEPVRAHPGRIDVGVVGPHRAGSPTAWELRAFFTDQHDAVREDPVTGSLNASIAGWLLSSGRASAPYLAAQGTRLGRSGRIQIRQDPQGVWVGGRATTLFSGVCTA
jgi:PhzF family phenazine biosynthesis protein